MNRNERNRVVITQGQRKGMSGTVVGQWGYPFHLWTIRLDRDGRPRWVSLTRRHFRSE